MKDSPFNDRYYHDSYWNAKTNKLTIWSFDRQGKLHQDYMTAKPYLYVESPESGSEGRQTMFGTPVTKLTFPDRYAYNKALKELDPGEKKLVHENSFVPPEMGLIADLFPTEPPFDPAPKILTFDIEVHSDKGFPLPDIARWPVTSICVCREWENDKMVNYGCKPLTDEEIAALPDGAEYHYCPNEALLILGFLTEVEKADIIAGWNSNQFDFPYLFNRMKRLALSQKDKDLKAAMNRGFNSVTVEGAASMYKSFDNNEKRDKFHPRVPGKALVDLLDLYKKYAFIKLPSYSLDNVGKFEFDDGKLKMYADGGSKELNLTTMFEDHWPTYVAYNIRDVALTRDIGRKRALIDLAIEINGISGIPIDRVTYMSAIIDGALLKFMRPRNMVSLGRHIPEKAAFKGGYVKTPIDVYGNGRRIYKHSCCFDVTSEYPSVVVRLNVSAETYVGKLILPEFEDQKTAALIRNVDDILPSDPDALVRVDVYNGEPFVLTSQEIKDNWASGKWTVSCDGVLFSTEKEGIFSAFTDDGFAQRKKFKREFQRYRDQYEDTHNEADKVARDKFFTKQIGRKLILNSGYGQTGSRYSRLYNPHIAQAITSTGQAIVFNGERFINEYFTTHYKDDREEILKFVQKWNPSITQVPFWDDSIGDRVVTMDTDSVIYTVDDLTGPVFDESDGLKFDSADGGEAVRAVNFINEFMVKFIEPALNRYLNEDFAVNRLKSTRSFQLGFELEGEKTSIGSIFLKKKKYILRIPKHNDDGTWSHKLKVTGYEMKKVNTPPAIAKGLELFVDSIFEDSHSWCRQYDGFHEAVVRTTELMQELTDTDDRQELMHRLANSTSINGLEKYTPEPEENALFKKGSPFHVKGALLHNFLVDKLELTIPLIYSGERGMVVRIKEEIPKCSAIAYKEQFPREFLDYVEPDVYTVAKTHFLNKCSPLFDAFGWEKEWTDLLKKLYKRDNDWPIHDPAPVSTLEELEALTVRQIKPIVSDQ